MKTALKVDTEPREGGYNVSTDVHIESLDECMAVFRALIQGFKDEPMAVMCLALAVKELRDEANKEGEEKEEHVGSGDGDCIGF